MPNKLRSELPSLPARMAHLEIDERGYPVPWFVQWIDDKPDFRVMHAGKRIRAVNLRLCWVCGQPLGVHMAFMIGPMCALNRVTAEPPSHRDCAEYSAKACPFLTRPHAKRREANLPEEITIPGLGVMHNPGVSLLWITRSYRTFPDHKEGFLLRVGDPVEMHWYAEGRAATRLEVLAAIGKGLPILLEGAKDAGWKARADLRKQLVWLQNNLPPSLDEEGDRAVIGTITAKEVNETFDADVRAALGF